MNLNAAQRLTGTSRDDISRMRGTLAPQEPSAELPHLWNSSLELVT